MKEGPVIDLSPDYGDVTAMIPVIDDDLRVIAGKIKPEHVSYEDWVKLMNDERIILVSKSFLKGPDSKLVNVIRNVV